MLTHHNPRQNILFPFLQSPPPSPFFPEQIYNQNLEQLRGYTLQGLFLSAITLPVRSFLQPTHEPYFTKLKSNRHNHIKGNVPVKHHMDKSMSIPGLLSQATIQSCIKQVTLDVTRFSTPSNKWSSDYSYNILPQQEQSFAENSMHACEISDRILSNVVLLIVQ